jgi:UDP-galactopyranose mutase
VSINIYNLVFRGDYNLEGSAIYFPEKKFIFRRVCVLKNLCPALARSGYTTLSVEISNTKNFYKRILKDFSKIEQFRKLGKPIDWKMTQVDFAYPLQLNGLKAVIKKVHKKFEEVNIYHCGRGGNYDYCNSDKAYEQGKMCSE